MHLLARARVPDSHIMSPGTQGCTQNTKGPGRQKASAMEVGTATISLREALQRGGREGAAGCFLSTQGWVGPWDTVNSQTSLMLQRRI